MLQMLGFLFCMYRDVDLVLRDGFVYHVYNRSVFEETLVVISVLNFRIIFRGGVSKF